MHIKPYETISQRTENPCVGGSIPSITTLVKAFSKERAFFVLICVVVCVHNNF